LADDGYDEDTRESERKRKKKETFHIEKWLRGVLCEMVNQPYLFPRISIFVFSVDWC